MKIRNLAVVAAALGAVLAAAPAIASPITYEISGNGVGNDPTADVTYSPVGGGGFTEDVYVGPLSLNITNQSTNVTTTQTVYCSDIFDDYQSGGIYKLGLLSDTVSLAVAQQVDALLTNVTVSTAVEGAALQAAIWKVEFDPGNYDIQHGIFSISPDGLTGDNATYQAFIALADSYLASVSNGTFHAKGGTIVKQYTGTSPSGAKDQSFVVVNAPEPASLALLASGFVALAGLRRHRCQRPATAAG